MIPIEMARLGDILQTLWNNLHKYQLLETENSSSTEAAPTEVGLVISTCRNQKTPPSS